MATSAKQLQSKRAQMRALIQARPGITSGEIAERIGLDSATRVTNALWKDVRAGRIMTERVERDGHSVNAHYLPDQVPADAVERINQKLVDVKDVIPTPKSPEARNSAFDVPRVSKGKKQAAKGASSAVTVGGTVQLRGFACAVTNNGSLLLMREGHVQFALTDTEATALQRYLLKRAAANLFASMA